MSARRWAAAVVGTVAMALGTAPAAATPGPAGAKEYWFDDWQIPSLWADGARGQGVTIAEIDTGVNAELPELRGRVVKGTDLGEPGDGQVDREIDEFGHGTAMASLMVARAGTYGIAGMAPGAKVLPIAVPLQGTSDAESPDHLATAIRYAADHGAKIISMSLGERRTPGNDPLACPADEQAAVFHALRKGSVVVAAVGNTGQQQYAVVDPGVCLGVVAVGAVDASGTVAPFSARARYLTLTAPGVGIASLSRVEGRAYSGAGTSQATALTAAGIALVWSRFPRLSGPQVVGRLLATLDGKRTTRDSSYGYGRLDVARAVTADLPRQLPNPVYEAAEPFLTRADVVAKSALGAAPPAAAESGSSPRGTGDFATHSSARWRSSSVVLGSAAALAGLVLLAGLLIGAAVRRRRARRPRPPSDSLPADTPPPAPDVGWPLSVTPMSPTAPTARVLPGPPEPPAYRPMPFPRAPADEQG